MLLYFPNGAGGNWLSHLIYCLQNNTVETVISPNYHSAKRLELIHDHGRYDLADYSKDIIFGGRHAYNYYINFLTKGVFVYDPQMPNKDPYIQVVIYSKFANMLTTFADFLQDNKPHLYWDRLYIDEDQFIDDLFCLLKDRNIKFNPNRDIAHAKISEYKATNIDPMLSYDNQESLFWQGWCLGYMQIRNMKLPYKAGMPSRDHLLMAKAKKLNIAERSLPYLLDTNSCKVTSL